jgi:antitoxin component YwqK of YwqJK toxin-antitoxin module
MNLLHDAYTAWLSGLTYKDEKGIHWQDKYDNPITISDIDIETKSYVVRYWYQNGQLQKEVPYQQGQRHGVEKWWYDGGQPWWEIPYQQGQIHGVEKGWHDNGWPYVEVQYQQWKKHGVEKRWYENGKLQLEAHWEHGMKQ